MSKRWFRKIPTRIVFACQLEIVAFSFYYRTRSFIFLAIFFIFIFLKLINCVSCVPSFKIYIGRCNRAVTYLDLFYPYLTYFIFNPLGNWTQVSNLSSKWKAVCINSVIKWLDFKLIICYNRSFKFMFRNILWYIWRFKNLWSILMSK